MWMPYALTCLLAVNFQMVAGQCLSADSLFKKISVTENLSSPDVDRQLRGLQILEKQRRDCPLDSAYTYLLLRIGVAYYRLADYVRAIDYTKRAITLANQKIGSVDVDRRSVIRGYYNLSAYYDSLRLSSQKDEAADSCISNIMRAKRDYYFACFLTCSTEKVRLRFLNGDYGLCADYATLGENLVRNYYAYSDKMDYIIRFAIYKTSALYSLNRFSDAEHYFNSVQNDFESRK